MNHGLPDFVCLCYFVYQIKIKDLQRRIEKKNPSNETKAKKRRTSPKRLELKEEYCNQLASDLFSELTLLVVIALGLQTRLEQLQVLYLFPELGYLALINDQYLLVVGVALTQI